MSKIKILSVFGTRPEAIKMAPLIKELQKQPNIQSFVCVTGQHRQMLDQVLEIFKIKPDYDLNIMQAKQTLTTITTNTLEKLDKIIKEISPDLVLVHGDTTTTLAASLAAFYNKVKIGHIEAGLRSQNKYSPYPEEINRKLTTSLADLHFAPTNQNKENLEEEGVKENIFITGNTVIDSLKYTVMADYKYKNQKLNEIKKDFENEKIILLTAHRRENLGTPLENICHAAKKIAQKFPEVNIIYPLHLNPVVQNTAENILKNQERIHLLPPLDVQDIHNLMSQSYMIMTDSGGIQEEAPSLGKPVLVLRNETERLEAVEQGTVKVIGTKEKDILLFAEEILTNKLEYDKMANAINPYGDGAASEKIVKIILQTLTL